MPKPNVTLADIIGNLETALSEGNLMGGSRITMNNRELLSLLRAIQAEVNKKSHAGDRPS